MEIGKMIRKLRREKDITQRELGKVVGVAESTISLYESGRNIPDLNMMRKFAVFFDVSLDYLAGNNDTIKKEPSERIFTEEELSLIIRFRKLSLVAQNTVLNLMSSLEEIDKTKNEQASEAEKVG